MRMGRGAKVSSSSSKSSSTADRGRSKSIVPSSQTAHGQGSSRSHSRPGTSIPSIRPAGIGVRGDGRRSSRPVTSHTSRDRGIVPSAEAPRDRREVSGTATREDAASDSLLDANVAQPKHQWRSRTESSVSSSSAAGKNKPQAESSVLHATNASSSSPPNNKADGGASNVVLGTNADATSSQMHAANEGGVDAISSARDASALVNQYDHGAGVVRQQGSQGHANTSSDGALDNERGQGVPVPTQLPPTHSRTRSSSSANMYLYNPTHGSSPHSEQDSTSGIASDQVVSNTSARLSTLLVSRAENEPNDASSSTTKKRSLSMSLPRKLSPTPPLAPSIQSSQNTVVPLPARPMSARPLSARPKSAARRPVLSDLTAAAIGSLAK